MDHTFEINEGQRQMLVLAIAKLAIERPGWDFALGDIARIFQAEVMYQQFKELHSQETDHANRDPTSPTADSPP